MGKRIAIIASTKDPASINIFRRISGIGDRPLPKVNEGEIYFLVKGSTVDFIIIGCEPIFAENLDEKLPTYDLFVFLSRHESLSKRKTLSAHVPGNWTNSAPYGGLPKHVCIAPANFLTALMLNIKTGAEEEDIAGQWSITFEVTHHGPYIEKIPTVFVEIGSSRPEWNNPQAGRVIADAILKTIKEDQRHPAAVSFGGPHYAPSVNRKILLEEYEIAVGHMIPGYVFDEITVRDVKMALERTLENVEIALVDKKGLKKKHRDWLLEYLNDIDIEIVKI
ncbi:MAG: hypothetical protein J7L38_03455 [Thermoproteales archaeon]|nr:hypothetical protein [Thermoproteales archaeon]